MRLFTILILVVSIAGCNSNSAKTDDKHQIDSLLTPLLSADDSLSRIFGEKEFMNLIDTLKFDGNASPIKLIVIELYSASSYTVTNLKFVLLRYKDASRIHLFNNNGPPSLWNLTKSKKISISTFEEMESLVTNSPNWLVTGNSQDSSIVNGDISRYVAISNNNGRPIVDAIKFRDSPRSDLYERLITFYK